MKRLLPLVLAASALTGCATLANLPFFGSHDESQRSAGKGPSRDQVALREGIRLYHDGDFNGAIKRLSSNDIANGSVRTRVTALKYTAFSYCVTSRQKQCKQSFEKALKLDPSFDLAPGEHGHPLWGPVFARARSDG